MSQWIGRVVSGLEWHGLPPDPVRHPTPGCPRRRDRRADLRWAAGASRGQARLGCAPHRLRRGVAVLLWLGTATGALAVLSGLRSVLNVDARDGVRQARPDRFEAVRRAMVGLLFGLHTVCFRIYLQPDHGLRPAA